MPTLWNVPVPPTGQKSAVWGPQSARRPAVNPYRYSRNHTGTPPGVARPPVGGDFGAGGSTHRREWNGLPQSGHKDNANRLPSRSTPSISAIGAIPTFANRGLGGKTGICGLVTVLACQIPNAVRQCQYPTGRPPDVARPPVGGDFGGRRVNTPQGIGTARRKLAPGFTYRSGDGRGLPPSNQISWG